MSRASLSQSLRRLGRKAGKLEREANLEIEEQVDHRLIR
jgi:hypothetical protein